ncbi:MAG TPA: c-type cytochrome biogenesis protein CcmI, partial [Kiloniellales bacterium]|nr:c-type cytochrome biogenesis protein CcmI [Kiloniellales bacterium]
EAPAAAEHDLQVYRDQLAELERDLARGLLTEEQAAAARIEIERRLLAADRRAGEHERAAATPSRPAGRLAALAVAAGLPLAAFGLYAWLGAPGVPSQPFAERAPEGDHEFARLAQRLADRLAQEPGDRNGWLLLARTYIQMGRSDRAVTALRRALAQGFDDAEVQGALGEALVMKDEGRVGQAARRAFAAALEADPSDPRARYYAGLALAQDGRFERAIETWSRLAEETPAEAPWRDALIRQIAQAAEASGIEPPEIAAAEPATPRQEAPPVGQSGVPGPSAADVAAAQEMTDEERAAFIQQMVGRLADRLEREPDDLAGWLRLARAYTVLGERDKADAALGRAEALVAELPADAPERAALESAREALSKSE